MFYNICATPIRSAGPCKLPLVRPRSLLIPCVGTGISSYTPAPLALAKSLNTYHYLWVKRLNTYLLAPATCSGHIIEKGESSSQIAMSRH